MTDILIKSFNRPYYLDRCIQSIYKFVEGSFQITVMDDGTPQKYLEKIQQQYPKVQIIHSENYLEKNRAIQQNIENGTEINGFKIPTKLWKDCVKNASDYVLITEDDVWCTRPILIDDWACTATENNIHLLKLGWLGGSNQGKVEKISSQVERVIPEKLILLNKILMHAFFHNSYKFFTILYKLKCVDNYTINRYYVLNSILMGLFKKEYWLAVWENLDDEVNEKTQLVNSAVYYKKNKKNRNFIAKTHQECLKTTFQSSATNSYHKYGDDFDVNRMNYILNEAWFQDELNSMENFPNDFSKQYIKTFLDKANHPMVQYNNWILWLEKFKSQYRNLGCEVD